MAISSYEIHTLASDYMQFKKWAEAEPDDHFAEHMRKCVRYAIENELTERQRLYFAAYFVEGKSTNQIASEYGVNKSSVSRTITAGKRKLARVLVYSSPRLINAKMLERNRRIKK